ncbi:MAG: hypothetical protein JXB49_00880 [Bacteroidales bacterium]|nr:hypothetical protein [Bacteroidales bacterium]
MSTIWYYEQMWVEREDLRDKNDMNIRDYINIGLENFSKDDGVPISLKALLFNRYSHWTGGYGNDVEDFKEWYFNSYLNGQ